MSEESILLDAGLSNEKALRVLEAYLATAVDFRECLINYGDADAFSVESYDALLCLSIRRVQSAILLLGGLVQITEDELMSPLPPHRRAGIGACAAPACGGCQ